MNFYLDSADITTIDQYVKNYNIKGVTCNPTIIIKDGGSIQELVKHVPKDIELYLQVIAQDYEGIIKETKQLICLSPNIIVKIPATPDGLIAIRKLNEEGIRDDRCGFIGFTVTTKGETVCIVSPFSCSFSVSFIMMDPSPILQESSRSHKLYRLLHLFL